MLRSLRQNVKTKSHRNLLPCQRLPCENESNLHRLQISFESTEIIFLKDNLDRLPCPLYFPFANIDLQFSRKSFQFRKVLFALQERFMRWKCFVGDWQHFLFCMNVSQHPLEKKLIAEEVLHLLGAVLE